MLNRAKKEISSEQVPDPDQTFMRSEKNNFYYYSALLVILAGALCFLLASGEVTKHKSFLKICLTCIIAMAVNYTVVFGLLDILNFVVAHVQSDNSLSVVETQDQIICVLLMCFGTGMVYGFVFGWQDIGDFIFHQQEARFLFQEKVCLPLGALGGMLAGAVNEVLRSNSGKVFVMISGKEDPFDEEI